MKNLVASMMLPGLVSAFIALPALAENKHNHTHDHHNHAHSEKSTANKTEEAKETAEESKKAHEHKAHDHSGHNHTSHTPVSQKKEAYTPQHSHDHHSGHGHSESQGPFYGHLDVKLHASTITDAAEADEKVDEVYSHSHLELGAHLGYGFSANTSILLEGEPTGHGHGGGGGGPQGKDQIFKAHPLLIEQLTLNFDNETFALYGGKFNPVIGLHHEQFPGLFTYQTIEEYAVREKIGFGIGLKHNAGPLGMHRVDASTFFADTTFLSNSILFERGRTRKSVGGVSNTEDFSSYAISLGGSQIMLGPRSQTSFLYRIGHAHQEAGIGNDKDETRTSFSLGLQTMLTDEVSAQILGEHMNINHLDGEADHDRAYTTGSIRLGYQQWNFVTSYTYIHNDAGDPDEGAEGDVLQISAGYKFMNGIGVDVGYQRSDEENEVT